MKRIAKVVSILVVVLAAILIAAPFLIDANQFRPLLESQLTGALGREVKVGNLKLSLLAGSVTADDLSIADDPAFSSTPFVRAKSLSVAVDLMPLIFSRKINVTGLTIEQPEIVLLQTSAGVWNFSKFGTQPAPKTTAVSPSGKANVDLSVNLVKVANGRLSLGKTKSHSKPQVLDNVDIEVRDLSATSIIPFSLAATLPGDGEIKIDGRAGPLNSQNMVLTPANVSLKINHLDLTTSGVLENSPAIAGLVALDGKATSNGRNLEISGQLKAEKLRLVTGGSPAKRPLEIDITLSHDLQTESGQLKRGNIHIGGANASLVGSYKTQGDVTNLKATLNGPNMPIPELEAMLPALNITLPAGSSLQGGTASVKFDVEGPSNQLVATGSLGLNKTKLAGFDLGQKMSVIQRLAGIKGGPNTDIETLSANVRASQAGGATLDDIKFVAPAIGELSGEGTVSPANALDFKMKATVHTSGVMAVLAQTAIPFFVQGTASNPVFKPDVKGLATQELKSVKGDAVKTGLGLLNDFLDKKKK